MGDESVVLSNSELLNLGSANVYYYHRDKNEVMAGSLSEILDYKNAGDEKSTILILSREAVVHTVYIVTE